MEIGPLARPIMLVVLGLVTVLATSQAFNAFTPAALQLPYFKDNTTGPIGILTLSSGCPVEYKYATKSINTNLLRNEYFIDSINHLVAERIPERVVHAMGAGAFGYFKVTHDVTNLCKAKFLDSIGKRTRIAVRFSPVVPSRGGRDLDPAVRGFAIKFYTEEGVFDIPGFNFPVFVTQDPVKFASLAHAFKKNPANNLGDGNMAWDFITSNPESFLAVLMTFSDRGIPASNSRMTGYSVHTMQLSNSKNESYFSRFYYVPDLGDKNMLPDEAQKKAAKDPDYLARELYNSIGRGDYPSWTVYMQPLTLKDVHCARKKGIDVFDVSKELYAKDYPLRKIGKFVLNENPKNYFADVEQLGYCPGNVVPGILGSPGKMFEARAMAYRTAIAYRLGINFNKLPVNRPKNPVFTYNRDGAPPIDGNEGGAPNYYPNMFNGPQPVADNEPDLLRITELKTSNLHQTKNLYNKMSADERKRTAKKLAASLEGVIEPLEKKVIELFATVDQELADLVLEQIEILLHQTN